MSGTAPENLPQSGTSLASDRPESKTLAQTIRARTIDLVAMSLVLIVSLAAGRQVLEWWREDGIPVTTRPTATPWGEGGVPVSMEFGESAFSMLRQSVEGDAREALSQMVKRCGEASATAREPLEPPLKAEMDLLQRLSLEQPPASVAEATRDWRVCRLPDMMQLTVGIRRFPANPPDASGRWRVVCWAWLMRAGEREWSLYVCSPTSQPRPIAGIEQLPMPKGCRQVLSLREERGGILAAFVGELTPEECQKSFDREFAALGWKSSGWQVVQGAWLARYRKTSGSEAEEPNPETTAPANAAADVQFHLEGNGVSGVVSVIP